MTEFLGEDIAASSSKTSFITTIVGLVVAGVGVIGHGIGMLTDTFGPKKTAQALSDDVQV